MASSVECEEMEESVQDMTDDDEPKNEEDIMKILVATDIHLGYNERDSIRGDDSFNSFEEILKHAVSNEVDFLLLGGDLFHENKPSVTCYHRCLSLLKRYCLGDKPVQIEFLSDQSKNFAHLKNPIVNYEDPNMNVSIPVFSIHGNHDDPTGANQLSAMDIVADTGLINYFGKWTDLNQVEIYPLLMRKGETKLALYGLSHIKDERLSRLFRDKKVTMIRPQDPGWFNILVLHQNRAQNRGLKNYIPESVLPNFLNLVIWGHEHDCRLAPESSGNGITRISQPGGHEHECKSVWIQSGNGIVRISQPGKIDIPEFGLYRSSVATSLAIGESLTKKIGLLCVYKEKFMMTEIKLNTVRPFMFKEITLTKPDEGLNIRVKPSDYAKEKIMKIVDEMIIEVETQITDESPKLPLIRLVVNFTDDSLMSNQIRLGQQYNDRVANPNEMFSFKVKKVYNIKDKKVCDIKDVDEMLGDELADNIGELVDTYFDSKDESLKLLSTRGLCEAVSRFIDKNDTDALEDIYKHQFNKTFERIMAVEDLELTEENIDVILDQLKEERASKGNEEMNEIAKLLDDENRSRGNRTVESLDDSDDDVLEVSTRTSSSTSTSRGAAATRPTRGRGSRGPRKGRARGRAT